MRRKNIILFIIVLSFGGVSKGGIFKIADWIPARLAELFKTGKEERLTFLNERRVPIWIAFRSLIGYFYSRIFETAKTIHAPYSKSPRKRNTGFKR